MGIDDPDRGVRLTALVLRSPSLLDSVLMISCPSTSRRTSSFASHVAETARDCLRRSPYLMIRSVSCEYHRGTLVLRGQLPSFYHKQLTQAMVSGLPGVTQVTNLTEVVAPAH